MLKKGPFSKYTSSSQGNVQHVFGPDFLVVWVLFKIMQILLFSFSLFINVFCFGLMENNQRLFIYKSKWKSVLNREYPLLWLRITGRGKVLNYWLFLNW